MTVAPTVIWKKDVKSIIHRILWWMIDVGAPGQVLRHGWQINASKQLGIHRVTLHRQIDRMVALGILIEGDKKGEVMLNVKIFERQANRSEIRMEKVSTRRIRNASESRAHNA